MTVVAEPIAPPLPPEKARFLTEGLDRVAGFLIPSTALYLAGLEYDQRGKVAGGICEIGVYKGKSFLAMSIDLADGDQALAIDIFDLQHLNEDATATNVMRDFVAYLDQWGLTDRVDIKEGSSLDLEAEGFLEAGRRFRLFSVDGGHLAHHVLNDLRIAEATLVEGGIVAADDLLHAHFLGVITGVFQYLNSGGTLVPYALIPNKLLLTDAASVERNKAQLRTLFGAGIQKTDIPFHDSLIDVYGDVAWTVVDTDGTSAPLLRPSTDVAELTKEIAELKFELRRANSHKADLHRLLREARMAAAKPAPAPKPPSKPSGRADALPKALRRPARAVFRTIARLKG